MPYSWYPKYCCGYALTISDQCFSEGTSPSQQRAGIPLRPSLDNLLMHKELFLTSALAPRSRKVYKKAYSELQNFANSNDLEFELFPTSVQCLSLCIAYSSTRGLAASTIPTYVSAIGYYNKLAGHPDPGNNFVIHKMLKGYSKLNRATDLRLPITYHILCKLLTGVKHTTGSRYERTLLQAMFLLAFHSFLRKGEITQRSKSDDPCITSTGLIFTKSKGIISQFSFTLQHFKGHYGNPVTLNVLANSSINSPVKAMLNYVKMRGANSGPLFVLPGQIPVPRPYFPHHLNRARIWADLDRARFKGHSFRIGSVTSALTFPDVQWRY
ncbi:uncharacterized protein LOC117343724 [Pecten maximus]|uniref:uncharacterized protein LOC117343724 n=1 Tax=Pecten maximus TaxID=6579 RepID=UPI001458D98E|nr:uncharacterized protein LOC117343724 [Pecten maximus]